MVMSSNLSVFSEDLPENPDRVGDTPTSLLKTTPYEYSEPRREGRTWFPSDVLPIFSS
jgi:hypothetical protein